MLPVTIETSPAVFALPVLLPVFAVPEILFVMVAVLLAFIVVVFVLETFTLLSLYDPFPAIPAEFTLSALQHSNDVELRLPLLSISDATVVSPVSIPTFAPVLSDALLFPVLLSVVRSFV